MARKFARCVKCREWGRGMEVVPCPACEYQATRCGRCGGLDGAIRSVFAHFAYWRTRGGEDGGHLKRLVKGLAVYTRHKGATFH
jgi:hypothetical protein